MFDKDSFLAGVAVGRRLSLIGSNEGIFTPETMGISGGQDKKGQENVETIAEPIDK